MLAGLAAVLFVWFVLPFAMHGLRYPLGPDGPVYLWWTRLAGHDGLSAVPRPGVPGVALVVQGATGLPLTAVTAGLEVSLSIAIGTACWALAREGGGSRWVSAAAGLLGGTFAVHLAAGYLATLAFAAAFVAALVTLARPTRRATIASVALLSAAAMSHPLFGLLALAILAVTAGLSWHGERADARRIATGVAATAGVVGIGLLALRIGPAPLHVDTSRDGFLRRAGLGDVLRGAYVDRFVHRWTRYVEWFSIPLAAVGWRAPGGFVRRALAAWALVTAGGVATSLATGWFPPDRFITFGFAIPVLAAFGLERLWAWLGARRRVAALASALLVGSMLAGSWIAWARQEPFMDDREVQQVTSANAVVRGVAAGTPLVFLANESDQTVSFLATRAANVIRAAIEPARIRDVVVVVPPLGPDDDVERAALARLTAADVREASGGASVAWRFATTAFDPVDTSGDLSRWTAVGPGVFLFDREGQPGPTVVGEPSDALEPADTPQISIAALATLALFAVGGYGWARAASFGRGLDAAGVAPAFGWGAFTVVAIALERVGVPLTGTPGPLLVSALVVGGGFLVSAIRERRSAPDTAHEVE